MQLRCSVFNRSSLAAMAAAGAPAARAAGAPAARSCLSSSSTQYIRFLIAAAFATNWPILGYPPGPDPHTFEQNFFLTSVCPLNSPLHQNLYRLYACAYRSSRVWLGYQGAAETEKHAEERRQEELQNPQLHTMHLVEHNACDVHPSDQHQR